MIFISSKILNEAFRILNQVKIQAHAVSKNRSLTKDAIKEAIQISQDYHDKYKHLSHDHLVNDELIDLRKAIHALKGRLK